MVQDILSTYWNNSEIYLLYCSCIVIILLIENDKWKKMIFGWYQIVVYILLINPITIRIGNLIWGEDIAYYARQFTLLLVFAEIAYAGVALISRIKSKIRFVGLILSISIFIFLGDNTFEEAGFGKAENLLKIPNDVIDICNYVDEMAEKPILLVPNSLTLYIRQYDAAVHLLYGRENMDSTLANQISSDNPDMSYILQESCNKGVDFIVLNNNENIKIYLSDNDIDILYHTKDYLIIEPSGYSGVKYTFDYKERIKSIEYLDENRKRNHNDDGYSKIVFNYYDDGRKLSERYYDENDVPTVGVKDYYGLSFVYDEENRIYRQSYLDVNGEVFETNGYYATQQYEYDENGRQSCVMYLNRNGEYCESSDGIYGYRIAYDSDGRVREYQYLNKKGKLTETNRGYAILEQLYDENGRNNIVLYKGKNGELKCNIYGYAKTVTNFDAEGRVESIYYYDSNSELVTISSGYAYIKYVYSIDGEKKTFMYMSNGECIN